MSGLISGQLVRSMLVLLQQLRLLMEEEVEAVDSLLRRNDFNLQLMATIPAFGLFTFLLLLVRSEDLDTPPAKSSLPPTLSHFYRHACLSSCSPAHAVPIYLASGARLR